MKKIIVITGFSGSGKDKISKWIADNLITNSEYKFVKLDSSRPIRQGESQGNPYNFISKEKFELGIKNDNYIEYRIYNTLVQNIPDTWYYGTHKNSINENNYIIVLSLDGLLKLKKYYKNNIISFFIKVDEKTRKERCIKRNSFDEIEWNRRFKDEYESFPDNIIIKEVDFIIENYDFNKCIKEIIEKAHLKTKK